MEDNFLEIIENEEKEKKNKIKYKSTIILAVISGLLIILYILLPSKKTVKEVEVKKIERNLNTVEIQAYFIEGGALKSYIFTTNEDSYSNLLKATVEDILEKSSQTGKKTKLLNTYFSDYSVYFELDNKNLDGNLREAIQKTTVELLGVSDINFI